MVHGRSGPGGARPGAGRPRRPEVDEAITAATLAALQADGYARLSVADVAHRAGVAPSTVYRRWPSKATLVAHAATTATLTPPQPPDTGTLRGDLQQIVETTYRFFTGPQGELMRNLVTHSGRDPELEAVVHASTRQRRSGMGEIIRRAVSRGELPPSTDSQLVADLFTGPLWTRLLVTGGRITRPLVQQAADLVAAALAR